MSGPSGRVWIWTNLSDVKSHSLSRTAPDSRQSELEIWSPDVKTNAGQMVQKRIIFGFRMVLFMESSERIPWREKGEILPLDGQCLSCSRNGCKMNSRKLPRKTIPLGQLRCNQGTSEFC